MAKYVLYDTACSMQEHIFLCLSGIDGLLLKYDLSGCCVYGLIYQPPCTHCQAVACSHKFTLTATIYCMTSNCLHDSMLLT